METTKKITLDTNYNGKLGCNAFCHLDLPPKKTLTVEQLEKMQFEFATEDNSHENVLVKCVAVVILNLKYPIPEIYTYTSHGMSEEEFVDHIFKKYPVSMPNTMQLAAYYYKKN